MYFSINLFIVSLILISLLMDDKNLSEKLYVGITKDTVIDIKVNGTFYADLKRVFVDMLLEGENKDGISKILANISKEKVTNTKEYRLYVLYMLLTQIELEASAQGLTSKVHLIPLNPEFRES